jgi:hypothetical protein
MPQSWDMGQIVLLHLRRKACLGFFHIGKNPAASVGNNNDSYIYFSRPGVAQCLRPCATSRTVPGSIPDVVTGFFIDIFPSDRTMALGPTKSLVKMSTRNIPGGKGGWCVRVTTSPPLSAE